MKFYPADWRADEALRSCSIAARGLWVEMMALMHVAEPYGSLLVKGKRPDRKQLANLAGISEKDCTALLLELEGMAVFARDDDGTIYSRRMRRDAEKAVVDKENGKRGGNPKITEGVNPPDNGEDKAHIPDATARKEDGIGDARAGASKFTEGSKALASAFWKALGFESPLAIPPEFAGVDWRAIEWERAGWTADLIDAETRKNAGKPLAYHEKCFATAFAKRQAPLPIVEIKQAETLQVTRGTSKPQSGGSLIAALDRQIAALESEDGADFALSESPVLRISN